MAKELEDERAHRSKSSYIPPDILWYTAADAVLYDGYTTVELAAIIAEGIHRMSGSVFEKEKLSLAQIARRIVRVLAAPDMLDETVEMRATTTHDVMNPLPDFTQEIPIQ